MATTQNTFNGNGSNLGPFSFTFKWLESTDIKVSVGGVLKTAGTHYNLQGLNYTTKTGGQVLFTAGNAPSTGTNNIRIYRDTDDAELSATFSSGSAIRAKDLNDNFTQNLYVTQEVNNNSVNIDGSNPMVGNLDMGGKKILNLATPASSTDASTKGYVDSVVATGAANAAAAAASASAAASSASAAASSATAAANTLDSFDDRYLGAKATDPTVDNDGNALLVGAIYFNSTSKVMRVWNGANWQDSSANANVLRWRKTAVGGETTLSGNDNSNQSLTYTVNLEAVFLNGALLQRGVDYVATTGNSITGLVALTAGDVVEVLAFSQVSLLAIPSSTVTFTQSGTGAVQRTVESKLKDVVSVKDFGAAGDGTTNDTAAIQAAINYAVSNAVELYWPAGSYSSNALTSVHSVRHHGNGSLLRGSSTFYLNPTASQTNTLYVSSSGSASADGLSSTNPTTIQAAFNYLSNYGPVLAGAWEISLASGSYSAASITFPARLDSEVPVLIYGADVGGHPNIPTTIFTRGSQATSGLLFQTSKVTLRNIKFNKFNSNSSSYAVAVREQGQLYTENVHVDDAYLGIVGYGQCVLNIQGGIIANCNEGVRSLFNCYHTLGSGSLAAGPVIKNCEVGFSAREASSGHADYVNFQDNAFGISSEVNARVNCGGSDFKRNTVAIRIRGGNVLRTGVTFNDGTADANTENVRVVSFGQDFTSDINALTRRVRHRDVTSAGTISGVTTETVMATYNLAAGLYKTLTSATYVGKCIRITMRGNMTGTGGNKTLRVRFGGLAGTNMNALVTTGAGRWEYVVDVFIRGNTDQRINGSLIQTGSNPILGAGTLSYDLTSASDIQLVVTGTTANSADSIIYDYFSIEVEG